MFSIKELIPLLLGLALSLCVATPYGLIAYFKLRQFWRPLVKPSAAIARERLEWCVKTRKDGGNWVTGPGRITYNYTRSGTAVRFATYRPTFRWVHA